ncbi:hypothetical protein [Nocardiopsis exhalans]|nr:hypothetical protein [Nocardiopsis exhalans]
MPDPTHVGGCCDYDRVNLTVNMLLTLIRWGDDGNTWLEGESR